MSNSTIQEKIDAETALIEQLKASYPSYDNTKGDWSKENRPHSLHGLAERDARWRRRMLIAKRDGEDVSATAKIF